MFVKLIETFERLCLVDKCTLRCLSTSSVVRCT